MPRGAAKGGAVRRLGASGIVAAGILGLANVQRGDQPFEGTIAMRTVVTSLAASPADPAALFARPADEVAAEAQRAGGDVTIDSVTLFIKGSRLRVQGHGVGAGYVVFDYEHRAFRLVNPAQRAYVEWTADEFKAAVRHDSGARAPPQADTTAEAPMPRVRALGTTRTINGMECEAYEVRTANAIAHVWVTAAHPDLVTTFTHYLEAAGQLMLFEDVERDPEALVVDRGFPVLVQTLVPARTTYRVSEAVAIDPRPLTDDLFDAPAGYQRLTLSDLIPPDSQ